MVALLEQKRNEKEEKEKQKEVNAKAAEDKRAKSREESKQVAEDLQAMVERGEVKTDAPKATAVVVMLSEVTVSA